MKWHLALIQKVVRQAPDEWDFGDPENDGKKVPWKFYYNMAGVNLIPERLIRSPEDGLKRVFGFRPWVWQQFALLRIEQHLRFQEDHERDFAETDCVAFADKSFDLLEVYTYWNRN